MSPSITSKTLLITLTVVFFALTIGCGSSPNEYTLNIAVEPAGTASIAFNPEPNKNGKYPEDTIVTVSITPSPGYKVETWNGHVSDRNSPTTTIIMNRDQAVELQLEPIVTSHSARDESTPVVPKTVNAPSPTIIVKAPTDKAKALAAEAAAAAKVAAAKAADAKVAADKAEAAKLAADKAAAAKVAAEQAEAAQIAAAKVAADAEVKAKADADADAAAKAKAATAKAEAAKAATAKAEAAKIAAADKAEAAKIAADKAAAAQIAADQAEAEAEAADAQVAADAEAAAAQAVAEAEATATQAIADAEADTTVTEAPTEYSLTISGNVVTGPTLELVTSTISISPAPTATNGGYPEGTTVQITVTPKTGYILSEFSGQVCSSIPTCTLNLDSDLSLDLTFLETYSISINTSQVIGSPVLLSNGRIGISPPNAPESRYHEGTIVTLVPEPDLGFQFAGWDGACVGIGSCSILMNQNWDTLTASFKSATLPDWATNTVSLSSELIKSGGDAFIATIFTQDNTAPTVTTVSFSLINPANVTEVKQGSPCGSSVSGDVTSRCWNAVFSLPANSNISSQVYRIVASSPNMTNSPEKSVTVEGTTYSLNINGPKVTANSLSLSGGTLALSEAPNGMDNQFLHGTQVIITPVPDEGFQFLGWTGDCTGTGACIVLIDQNRSITGTFGST